MSNTESTVPVKVIRAHPGWRFIDFGELSHYRDLFYFLVARNIKVLYKQTVLGFSWAIIRPLFSTLIFTVIFGKLANLPSDRIPYPVFCLLGVTVWNYFSSAMTGSTESLINSSNLLTKVYFPRIVIPLTPIISALVDFAIGLVVVAIVMAIYGCAPGWNIVFIPIPMVVLLLTAAGIGMWMSAMAIQYRDVRYAVQFFTQLLMYAAPVVWPASLITEKLPVNGHWVRLVYGFYPMGGVIEGFRACLLNSGPMPWDLLGIGLVVAVFLFITGAMYFRRMERVFADVA